MIIIARNQACGKKILTRNLRGGIMGKKKKKPIKAVRVAGTRIRKKE